EQYCYAGKAPGITLEETKVLYADFQCENTVDVKKSKSCEADVSSDLRQEVENHYKLSLPEDFYHFWKFCEELDPEKPAGILLMNFLYMLVQMKQRKTA
uniref:Histone PARylation factor 1 n=1 Tax=Suricata suricatta TaxID=37032 RepID=A0A673UGV1_SURSU